MDASSLNHAGADKQTSLIRRGMYLLAGLGLLAGVYVVGVLVYVEWAARDLFSEDPIAQVPFDSEAWQREGATFDGTRQSMVQDLLENHSLLGRSEAALRELLGPPNTDPPAETMHYILGPEPGPFGIDSEWLLLHLDEHGVVTGHSTYRD